MSVSFSDTNHYIDATGRNFPFAAPADQVGDDNFDLYAFEQNPPDSPSPTSDPVELVRGMAQSRLTYKERERRLTRQLRAEQREKKNLKIQVKTKKYLGANQREQSQKIISRLRRERDNLIGKNKRYATHSKECKRSLLRWKVREGQLLGRVSRSENTIDQLRRDLAKAREEVQREKREKEARISQLQASVSSLQQDQMKLQNEIAELRSKLAAVCEENETFSKEIIVLRSKEETLAAVKATLKTQLELLVNLGR